MGEVMKIMCSKCKKEYEVHKPEVLRVNSRGISQVTLFSSEDLMTRHCPACGACHAPCIRNFDVEWLLFEKKTP